MKKIVLIILMLMGLMIPAAGCASTSDSDTLSSLKAWLENYQNGLLDSGDGDGGVTDGVLLRLTYPAGRSPNVFTTGWLFGAACSQNGTDYSDQVKWSGSGTFSPDTGTMSRPSFNGEGANTITLSIKIDDKEYSRTFNVNAISPEGYACVGMFAECTADSHGSPADPLDVKGPITTGSSHVLVNGRPAARVGDIGIHSVCAGANKFEIVGGDENVLIDGRPAAKIGDTTRHCGGIGKIIGYIN
ncbi:MAG: PAAR domain-containing protein [Dehalococcoidales bacterium]|jgi:uncharacterized Zn-binding protein involved in type VI secretion